MGYWFFPVLTRQPLALKDDMVSHRSDNDQCSNNHLTKVLNSGYSISIQMRSKEGEKRIVDLGPGTEANDAMGRIISATDITNELDAVFDPVKAAMEKLVKQGVLEQVRPGVFKPKGK